ncbi:Retinoic acid induced 16-like protein-domain-containing protein [Dissophora ornata]|nr:Retinoic acid induced 16-like protein-domain-containing protein [Dissophora ornata]
MDSSFWNKLKKTIMTVPKEPPSNALQLSRFSKSWLTIQTAISTPEKRNVAIQQTEISIRLKNMVDLLVDEESRLDDTMGATGVCMEHLLRNNILAKLVNTCAEGDNPQGIIGETIRTLASMINLLDDRFLVHNAVHKPTVKLLRICCGPGTELEGNESYQEDLIDLMYILCSKIHGYSELLNIFFYDKQWLTVPERTARRLQKGRETIALLKSLSRQSNLALSNLDYTPPSDKTSAAFSMLTGKSEGSTSKVDEPQAVSSFADGEQQGNFFMDAMDSPSSKLPNTVAESKRDYEFLLFTYLSKFVHREGKAGDFARTGLLFLMELATGSLGEYILDSDFASYLTAGIGALYSQLPRKLIVRGGPNDLMSSTAEDEARPSRRANIELSTSADFQSRLDAFLKVLEFCQDVLMRCPNSEIAATLLSSLKIVFLENILYPSILECSDTDGSSVAVISYIDQILQVIEHEALVDLVVGFLMESEEEDTRSKNTEDEDAFAEVHNPQITSPYFTALGRFTLKDLVLSRLKSRSQATTIATLKLLNTIITKHCKYSLKLLSIQLDNQRTSLPREQANGSVRDPFRDVPMINHYTHELDLFFALITTINPYNTQEIFSCGYDAYLRDAEGSVKTHHCSGKTKDDGMQQTAGGAVSDADSKKQRRKSMKYGHRMDHPDGQVSDPLGQLDLEKNADTKAILGGCTKSGPGHEHSIQMHRLLPSDPLLQILLRTLSHFFAHSVELNLALTGVISSLAACPYRSLEGWLLFRTSDVKKPDVDRDSGEDESESELSPPPLTGPHVFSKLDPTFHLTAVPYDSDDEDTVPYFVQHRPSSSELAEPSSMDPPSFKSFPPFFTMLRTLTKQVAYYRSEIEGFDEYLAERRRTLLLPTVEASAHANVINNAPGLILDQSAVSNNNSITFNPGFMHVSSDSFFGPSGDLIGTAGARPSPPTLTGGSSSNLLGGGIVAGGPSSPRIPGSGGNSAAGSMASSPALQRPPSFSSNSSTTNNNNNNNSGTNSPVPLSRSPANPVTLVRVNTPRARKSSSPSSLMATPSNVPFLVAPGVGGKRNFRSNSASPLAGGGSGASATGSVASSLGPRYPSGAAATGADVSESASLGQAIPSRTATKSPELISQPRALWSSSNSGAPAFAGSSSSLAKPVIIGGMAAATGFGNADQGSHSLNININVGSVGGNINSASMASSSAHAPSIFGSFGSNPLSKVMDTMMVRPLFPDGFVDDSDCEEESTLQIRAKLRDSNIGDEDNKSNRSSSSSKGDDDDRKTRNSGDGSDDEEIDREANSDLQEPRRKTVGTTAPSQKTTKASVPPTLPQPQEKMVTLGQLLTNVIILEEVVKEVVAVAQVRKAMGVDKVRFL